MQTEQDKINSVLKTISEEEYAQILEELKAIPSFAGHLNHELTLKQRAVMTKEASLQFKCIFDTLKLDYVNDPNLKSTPIRIASMWVNELMAGRYQAAPRIESFPVDDDLSSELDDIIDTPQMFTDMEVEFKEVNGQNIIVSKRVDVRSLCSHHFMPFFNNENNAYAVIAYKPGKTFLGISKLQRIVNFYASRPQLQENLTQQIFNHIARVLGNKDILVCMKNLTHTCESLRGVQTICGKTSTIIYDGCFKNPHMRAESINLAI